MSNVTLLLTLMWRRGVLRCHRRCFVR